MNNVNKFQPEIVKFEALEVCGISVEATYANGVEKCTALWEKFCTQTRPEYYTKGSYGVSVMNTKDGYTYYATLPVTSIGAAATEFEHLRLPGGDYARCRVNSLGELGEAYAFMYGASWLTPDMPFKLNMQAPCFEYYPPDFTADSELFIYAPLAAK